MNKIILNIPHSSIVIPDKTYKNICVNKKIVDNFNLNITDLYSDELFGNNDFVKIIAPYSRVFCDIEKFVDEKYETMAKYGQGFIYSKTNNGVEFLKPTNIYKNEILNSYYKPQHEKIDKIVSAEIDSGNKVIFVDCHSFGKNIIMDKTKKENLPDICIGFDEKYYSEKLIKFVKKSFENFGYKVSFNYPYNGVMIPDCYLKKDVKNLYCVMIEINKKIYLDRYQKNSNFYILQSQINSIFQKIKNIKF